MPAPVRAQAQASIAAGAEAVVVALMSAPVRPGAEVAARPFALTAEAEAEAVVGVPALPAVAAEAEVAVPRGAAVVRAAAVAADAGADRHSASRET